MTRERQYIPYPERLAAALVQLLPQEQRDVLRDVKVSAAQVIAMFQFDHGVLHALDGSDAWFNLWPMLKPEHQEKSRRDTGIVAKVKRVSKAQEEHRRKMLAPKVPREERPSRWGKRKMQSKNTFRGRS
jgi:hypothetical protein